MTKLEKLFRVLYEGRVKQEEWFAKLPPDISAAFFDNPAVNSLEKTIEEIMDVVLLPDDKEDIDWFMNEWMNDNSLCCRVDGKEYQFKNIDDYIDFLKAHFGWGESND